MLKNMKNKIALTVLAVAIVSGSVGFYGGLNYGKKNLRNPDWRVGINGQSVGSNGNFRGGPIGGQKNNGENLVAGEIISKDDKSLTVKIRNGSSKIVFFATSTEISKFANGAVKDLEIGKTVIITGTSNSEGSITARSIQLRP